MTELGFQTGGRVRQRRVGGCFAVLIALAVLTGGGVLLALKGQEVIADAFETPDYNGAGEGEAMIRVREGDTATAIAETLEREGVVKSASAFTQAAKQDERSMSIQPGYYQLRNRMAAEQALAVLLDPNSRVYDQASVPEGLRMTESISRLEDETGIPADQFEQVLDDPSDLDLPSYADDDAEGFLFPATYNVEPNSTGPEVLRQMVGRFDQAAQKVDLMDRADAADRSPRQIVIVASLIEKEARNPEDFDKVARVVYNRLDEKMPLQFDSTVHYILDESDRISTTRKERRESSPYNTYQHRGLPPGPISSPGERALEAALEPADGDWLYFVTTDPDTGETKFSESHEEHEKFAEEFNQWCRENQDRC